MMFMDACISKQLSSCKINFMSHVHILDKAVYESIYKKLATIVEGDLKALFSIATTLRSRGECYSIPCIAPLYP